MKPFTSAAWTDFGCHLALARSGADVAAEGDGSEIGAGVEERDVGVNDQVEELVRLDGAGFFQGALDRGAEFVNRADGDGVDDGLFIGKESIEATHGDAGFSGDSAGGDLFKRHFGK